VKSLAPEEDARDHDDEEEEAEAHAEAAEPSGEDATVEADASQANPE
jgi:hypothetical protein